MTQEEMEIFLKLVETRNLSKAASALYLSQSTLSHRLNTLEKELNSPLFVRNRGRRSIELTKFGYDFIPIAEQWMALWAQTRNLNTMQSRHRLAIGSVASLVEYLFPDLLHDFHKAHVTDICLMVKVMQSAALYPALEQRELDLGFSVLPSEYSNIVSIPLLEEENLLVMVPDNGISSPDTDSSSSVSAFGSDNTVPSAPVFSPDISPGDLDPGREILFQYHQDYTRWHNQWFGYFTQPAAAMGDGILSFRFLSQQPGSWAVFPVSAALAAARQIPCTLHHLTNPPPTRVCYILEHRFPRPGTEETISLFRSVLDAFMDREEASGHLHRL